MRLSRCLDIPILIFESLYCTDFIPYFVSRIFLYAAVFLQLNAWAQNPHPTFKQYDVEDGLASSKVYCVRQDSRGYIWFATSNGVSRFNGYEFENFSITNGLLNNTVFEIFEDKTGKVWFVPLSNMLSYYENGKIHHYKYNHLIRERIKEDPVKTSFYVDEKGTVFLGLYRYGICEISPEGDFKLRHHGSYAKAAITVEEPAPRCFVYANIYPNANIYGIHFSGKTLPGVTQFKKPIDDMPASTRIISLRDGTVALAYHHIVYLIHKDHSYEELVLDHRIISLYEDREGGIWAGTYLGGVYYFDKRDLKKKTGYLPGLSVTGVIQDAEGGLWIATEGNSVYYSHSKDVLTYDKESGFEDNRVSSLAPGKKSLFVGIQTGIIAEVDSGGTISYKTRFRNTYKSGDLVSLHYDAAKNDLWYSGSEAYGMLTGDVNIFQRDLMFYKLIPENDKGFLWGIGPFGLGKFKHEKNRIYRIAGKSFKRINAVLQKDVNTLYLGAVDGLWEYHIPDSTYTYTGEADTLLQCRIFDLAYAADGTLMIATKGIGLLEYKNGKVNRTSVSDGLSSDNVFKLLVEDSIIWAATDKGLSRIIRRNGRLIKSSIRVFTTFDGLASNEINDVRRFNNRLWLATDKGLSFFDPRVLATPSYQTPVYIHHISVNDSDRIIRGNYDLAYSENNIKIRFIALSYKNVGKQQYRYKMKGLNPDWSYTQEREIQYTTLPAGNYTFAVSVRNASGTWSRETEIGFAIATPFWKTWWFLALALMLGAGGLFYVASYWSIRKHKRKSKEEEINRVLLQLKLKALRAQMNPHFIFNVMNSIQHFIIYRNGEAAQRYLSKFAKLIRAILNNSDRNTVPVTDEIKVLELYLDLEKMRFDKEFIYTIQVEEGIDVFRTEIPSMLIQPYVENAVTHGIMPSSKTGKISVEITRQLHHLKCVIEDNGVGRNLASKTKNPEHRSYGTSITKERLAVINELYSREIPEVITDLVSDSGEPMGTRVEIYIPFIVNTPGAHEGVGVQ